ncbi:ADP-ribosylation factor-like protein 14 [Erpetoichthys calabaricus]|uniref:ADP-ribosylation factor-like protein 14 n=1 Tax=Erpetoichthys calabaricus TaxID=27687 RepID=UPI0010A0BB2B|nr:ADP-ribosylation factor-like protein 14 [Erpetoichthys calabaricus]
MGVLGSKRPHLKTASVMMIGLDATGKSLLLYRLKLGKVISSVPTIGFNVCMIEALKGFSLTIWDVGGQKQMRQHWKHYCQDMAGVVYVVDSTDKSRLKESKRELELILKSEHLKAVPLVLLANKQDIPGALNAAEITKEFKLKKLCSDRDWYVQPCSAVSGAGLEEGLKKIAELVKMSVTSKAEQFIGPAKNAKP